MCPMPRIMRRDAEHPAGHVGHLALGLPVGLQRPAERRQLALGRDVVELEAGVARVHVQVDAEVAARVEHALREVLGRDARAVEVADESVVGEADGAARAVDLIGPARRRAAPPVAAPRVEAAVLHERGEVLAVADDVVGRVRSSAAGHAPKRVRIRRAARRPWPRRAWAAGTRCRWPDMPYSPCCAWKPPLKAATRCFMTSGVRGTRPGPCSPLAATGSTVPASMWSAICRGSQSVT